MFCVALSMGLFVLCVVCLAVFGETIRNIYGCVFVVECYGSVECEWMCSAG